MIIWHLETRFASTFVVLQKVTVWRSRKPVRQRYEHASLQTSAAAVTRKLTVIMLGHACGPWSDLTQT